MTADFNSKPLTTPCKRTLRNYDVRRLNVKTSSAEWTTDARARACVDVSNFLSFGHELAFRWKKAAEPALILNIDAPKMTLLGSCEPDCCKGSPCRNSAECRCRESTHAAATKTAESCEYLIIT